MKLNINANLISLSLFLLIFLFVGIVQAEQVIIVTDEWKSYTDKDETGYYFDLVREVFAESGYTIKIKFMPFKRSMNQVGKGEVDMALGSYLGDAPEGTLYSLYPTEADSVDAIMKVDTAKNFKNLDSLKNKNVVAKLGYGLNLIFQFQ